MRPVHHRGGGGGASPTQPRTIRAWNRSPYLLFMFLARNSRGFGKVAIEGRVPRAFGSCRLTVRPRGCVHADHAGGEHPLRSYGVACRQPRLYISRGRSFTRLVGRGGNNMWL